MDAVIHKATVTLKICEKPR